MSAAPEPVAQPLCLPGRPTWLFRLRDYHLLFPNLMVRMANTMSTSALPLLLVSLSFSPGHVGWIVSFGGLTSMLMNLVGGVVSDRFTKKRLMLLGVVGVSITTTLLGLARSSTQFICLRLGQGLATGMFRPASQALAYELNPRRPAYIIGLLGSSYVLGNAAGPALGGYLADGYGLRTCIVVGGLLAAGGALYLLAVSRTLPALPRLRLPVRHQFRGLWVRGRRQVAVPLVVVLADAWILNAWHVYLPIYLRQGLGLSYTEIGLYVGLESAFYVLCQPLAGRLMDRVGLRLPLALSLASHGLFIASIPLMTSKIGVLACLLLVGITNSAAHPGSVLLTAKLAGEHGRGTSLGLLSSASNLGQFIGPIFGGVVIAATGQQSAALYACLLPALGGALAPLLLTKPDAVDQT